MFKAVIFDLDGTLINSIEDLSNACNYALSKNGFKEHELEKYNSFVGDGRYKLIERILPKESRVENIISKVLSDFDKYYGEHMIDMTKPYEGILELLEELNQNGIKTGVVSNKPHEFAKEIVKKFLGDRIDLAFGHREGFKTKPNPDTVVEVINKFALSKDECLYVGDSNVDIITGRNAGVKSAGVLWGFRSEEELRGEGATFIAKDINELKDIIYK